MSAKPASGGSAGAGQGGKQRPQRPQRPSRPKHKAAKPAKPAQPHHHHATGKAGRPKITTHHKAKRGLSPGVCCCAAEALAASLRLAGFEVTDHDVLDLYYLTANLPDDGASIAATVAAASEYGLAGFYIGTGGPEFTLLGIDTPGPHTVLAAGGVWWSWGQPYRPWDAQIEEVWTVRWDR